MKYFLVVGEASADLHASNLMRELRRLDSEASFRFFGGDRMEAVGGTLMKHYREMAFMDFVPVLLHAHTILRNMARCRAEIAAWKPDVLILVDYAGFNLKVASYVKKNLPELPVYYYISPKIWAWKEYRIRSFRKYIDRMYTILPFETAFFAKHRYPVNYVGNPSVDSVAAFMEQAFEEADFRRENGLDERPILALLPGSRTGEIERNLPLLLRVAAQYPNCQAVVAGAPGQSEAVYRRLMGQGVSLVVDETYPLLRASHAAVVTSGTATLETALIGSPQVVCYAVPGGYLPNWIFRRFMKVPYFSLVNLIAGKPVVKELLGGCLTEANLKEALEPLLTETPRRREMLEGYAEVRRLLGAPGASRRAAEDIHHTLIHRS